MSLNRNGPHLADHREAGRTTYLIDAAGAYIPGGAGALTTNPARAYGGKRATGPTLAAGAYIPGAEATSLAADIVDSAGPYGGAGASAPTIDRTGAYSGPAANMPRPAIAGTYVPGAGSESGTAKGVDPARAHSGAGASAATINPARLYGAPAAGAPAAAGANIPVSEANSAVAEIVDPAGAHGLAGASLATAGPAPADLGAGAGAPVLSPADASVPVSGTVSAATEIDGPAGAPGPARASASLSALSASPALDPNGAPPGYYYQAGATAYIEDPAGTYTPLAGATTPIADPGGTHSGPGASAFIVDKAGTYSSPYALDRLFLETTSATPYNRILSFNTLTALENYYGATSVETGLAAEFFTTYGSAANMLVVRFPLGGNRAHLYGADVSNLTLAQLQAINGTLSVTSQGYNYSASINLAGVTSPFLAAIAIQAALNENLPVAAVTTGSSIVPESASFTASANGLLLDVTSISSGSIQVGAIISGAGVPAGAQINSQFTGTPGGVGLYSLYVPAGVISSPEAMTESYGVLTVGSVNSGTVKDGEQVTGAGILPDTAIESNLSGSGAGSQWIVDFAQTVSPENMTMTGAPLSVLYTAVTGATQNSGYFSIQQNGYFNYNTATLDFAWGTTADALGLTKLAGAWLQTPGLNLTSESAFMNTLVQIAQTEGVGFGSFQATWPQLAEADPQAQAALAAWAQSTDGQFQFLNDTSDAPPAGTSTATIDPPGTWSGRGASLPTPATAGTYIPVAGATSALAEIHDDPGYYSPAGASAETIAPAGTFSPGRAGAPTPAAAGTYIPDPGATSSSAELVDPAGTYSPAGASAPTIDPAGTWSGQGASAPTLAAAGTYIPVTGATSDAPEFMIIDPAGSYSLAGASAYTLAQPGYYVPTEGASSETKDDPGFYTPFAGMTAEIVALPPTISGTAAGQRIAPLATDTPFSSVTIGDPNTNTTDSLRIELTGLGGTLTDGAGFDGLTTSGPGVYTLSGTAAAITSELKGLVFTSAAGPGTTTFTLTDTSSAGRSASDPNTTVIVESTAPPVVSVSDFLANQATLDQTPGGFDILDSAAAITASLDQLNDPNIDSITILDNGQVGASVQQLTNDETAIGKLKDTNSSPVLLAVHDTTANIEAGLSTLVADAGEIASITASDAPVVSVATFLADQSALDKIVGGFSISGTAADVAQNLDQLTAALSAGANITSIALTDGGMPTLAVSLEQALNDTLALNKIATPHSIVISDSAPASITDIEAIYLSGENIAVNGAPVIATGTVATMKLLGQIVTSLLVSQGYTLAVVDTAANIQALGTPQINSLLVRHVLLLEASDTSVALTASLAVSLEGANMVVTAPSGSTVTVADTAANLEGLTASEISGLKAIGVTGLVSTDANVTYTPAQTAAILASGLDVSALGSYTVIENIADNGTTTLAQVGDLFELNPTAGGEGPLIELNGSPVTAGQFPAGWRPVGAKQTGDGYEVAWSIPGKNEYVVWNTDSRGDYTSAATGILSSAGPTLEAVEANFGEDFAGSPEPTPTTIASNGTTILAQVGNLFELDPAGGGTGPLIELKGGVVSAGQFPAGWTPVAAKQTGDGYEVAWSIPGSSEYVVWNTDSNGDYTSAATGILSGASPTLEAVEANFGETFAGETFLGAGPPASTTLIATNGTTTLARVGNLFELNPAGGGTGPLLELNGSVVAAGQFPAGWTPVGAEQTASGYEVAWSVPGKNEYAIWNIDSNGNFTNGEAGVTPGAPAALWTINTNGATSLVQVGNHYELEAVSTGTGPLIELSGSAVTAGQFPAGWTPVGAEQTSNGYEVAWSVPGANEFVVWNTDSNGDYTSNATGILSGTSPELEAAEAAFGEQFPGAGPPASTTTIATNANSASAIGGLNASSLSFNGAPDAIRLGSDPDTVDYGLARSRGVETIANFVLGRDELNIDLEGAADSALHFYDTTFNGLHAISIASSANSAHGLVLLNMPASDTAAILQDGHTTFIGGHALIS